MAAGSRYGITLKELRELMEFRGAEGVEKLSTYGGAQGLAKKLNTSEGTGMSFKVHNIV
jgi:Ca2+ transporting ATPase